MSEQSGVDAAWREDRRAAFAAHAEAQRRAEAAEAVQAREIVAGFVTRARAAGIVPEALRARSYSGTATYRTALRGWYLQPSGPLAIGTDGELYTLTTAPSLLARLRGVTPEPTVPQLAVGRGARDGESMSLEELLDRRLAAGTGFRHRW